MKPVSSPVGARTSSKSKTLQQNSFCVLQIPKPVTPPKPPSATMRKKLGMVAFRFNMKGCCEIHIAYISSESESVFCLHVLDVNMF